jgi:hypothetical protein
MHEVQSPEEDELSAQNIVFIVFTYPDAKDPHASTLSFFRSFLSIDKTKKEEKTLDGYYYTDGHDE